VKRHIRECKGTKKEWERRREGEKERRREGEKKTSAG